MRLSEVFDFMTVGIAEKWMPLFEFEAYYQ
jgi:hypothetical protein